MPITDELRQDVATLWPGVSLRATDEGLLEPQKLRWPNEFARHKLVDLLGDLVLGGMCPGGRFGPARIVARGSGHVLNRRFVRAVVDAHQ
jgi:UDP-3-O-acyl-N-acetylglucosamine deacetylase